jgi:hypothetical protein
MALAIAVATPGSIAPAMADQRAALVEMANICAEGPTTIDDAKAAIGAAGWIHTQDPQVVFNALRSAVFSFQFNPEDVGYSLLNADFMAASILGNSALGPNQLGFTFDDLQLAVLAVEEGAPYCVATGPAAILDASVQVSGLEETGQTGPVRVRKGSLGEGSYADALLDLQGIGSLYPTVSKTAEELGLTITQDMFAAFLASIGEGTVQINSKAALQGKVTP